MKILQVHNHYKYSGGEDVVLKNEFELLTTKNHEVLQYVRSNIEIEKLSAINKGKLILETSFSKKTFKEISELVQRVKPDICHVHNILPLITPAIYYSCKNNFVPVVQTLHNYRLLCSNAYLFRNENICEECLGQSLFHSVKYGCYRKSRIQTFALARMIEKHKKLSTWINQIDAFIALTNFSKIKFVQGGLPKNKIYVKPNFLMKAPTKDYNTSEYFLFAGRLDVAKGIMILLKATDFINPNITIKIAGNGDLMNSVISNDKVNYLGQLPNETLIQKLTNSYALIFPSLWYEGFPMLIVEAFACGKPVIASNLGAMTELIEDGKTGVLFEPGNATDLASKINWAYRHREEMKMMGKNARKEYEEKYTSEKNYQILLDIYQKTIESSKSN